jgi:hypothetical protein
LLKNSEDYYSSNTGKYLFFRFNSILSPKISELFSYLLAFLPFIFYDSWRAAIALDSTNFFRLLPEHKLIDILTIAICGMICGADNWVAMEQYGNSKQEWLKQFLELPNGIPSHDTIARVFARIDPLEFEQCFRDWVKEIAQLIRPRGNQY